MFANSLGFQGVNYYQGVVEKWVADPSKFALAGILPMVSYPTEMIKWDILGGIQGMTHAGDIDSEAHMINHRKIREMSEVTRYWKEGGMIRASDIVRVRALGTLDKLAGPQLAMNLTKQLTLRRFTRIEWLGWAIIQNKATVDDNGVKFTADYTNLIQEVDAGSDWADLDAADPLADLLTGSRLLRGKADGTAKIYYNATTADYLCQNPKIRDLFKYNNPTGQLGPETVGNLIAALCNVESAELYDGGYEDESGNFQTFIDDGKVIYIGKPPMGQRLGHFAVTPAPQIGGLSARPGVFVQTFDKTNEDPPFWKQVQGINGIPVLEFPEVIIVMTVTGQ